MERKGLPKAVLIATMVSLVTASWMALVIPKARGGNPWEVWDYKTKPVGGGYFRSAVPIDIGMLNPNHWPINNWDIQLSLYESLFISDGNFWPQPWLVESFTFPDPVTCIMKLKKGITFSDGAPFNAAAVKFVEEWIMDPRNGCWTASLLKPIKSIEVLDEYGLRWNFKEPWGAFAGMMASPAGMMMSPKSLRENPRQPAGTGPFVLEERRPGDWGKLKRNPNWWYGRRMGHPEMPYFDGMITTVIPDPSVELASLRAGTIDYMVLNKSQYEVVKNDPTLQSYVKPIPDLRLCRFNHSEPPFNNILARQAVAYAINREALIAGVEFGQGRIASSYFPQDHWAHNPNLKPWPYDLVRARQLLKEAGYPNGLTITGCVYNEPQARARAEAIKGMLSEVGIDWRVDVLDPAAAAERLRNRDYHLNLGDSVHILDPDMKLTPLYHPQGGFNYGRSKNDTVISLLEKGRKETNPEKRQKIYWDVEQALNDNCEDVWLFWEATCVALSRNVMGYNHEMSVKHKGAWDKSHPLWFRNGRS